MSKLLNTDVSICRSCQADVYWMRSDKGKNAPIDARPSADGNCTLDFTFKTFRVLSGDALDLARTNGVELFKNHFATCPNASDHRRRKKAA